MVCTDHSPSQSHLHIIFSNISSAYYVQPPTAFLTGVSVFQACIMVFCFQVFFGHLFQRNSANSLSISSRSSVDSSELALKYSFILSSGSLILGQVVRSMGFFFAKIPMMPEQVSWRVLACIRDRKLFFRLSMLARTQSYSALFQNQHFFILYSMSSLNFLNVVATACLICSNSGYYLIELIWSPMIANVEQSLQSALLA